MVMLWRSFESLIRLMSLSNNQIASWFAFKFCYLNAPTKKFCILWYKDGKVYSKDSIKSKYLTNFQYFPIKFKFNHSASKNWFRGTQTNVLHLMQRFRFHLFLAGGPKTNTPKLSLAPTNSIPKIYDTEIDINWYIKLVNMFYFKFTLNVGFS